MQIKEELLSLTDWETYEDSSIPRDAGGGTVYQSADIELRVFEDLHIYLDAVDEAFNDIDLLVFASRHAGDSGALLTAHYTGNFGTADYGGAPGELACPCPNAHAAIVDSLTAHAPDQYSVGIECTHHGPTDIEIPSMFVEVGSSPTQWEDPAAARAVAHAILSLSGSRPTTNRTIVGFGGGHYAPRFERILRETDWAVGHIGAEWALESMEEDEMAVLDAAFQKSNATMAVIDGDHPTVREHIDELGYQIVSETFLRETTGVPLDRVTTLERKLSTIADGLRFGDRANTTGSIEIYAPDQGLLSELNGIDQDRVRSIVEDRSVAFETSENGNRVSGQIAVPSNAISELQEAFLALLREAFDSVDYQDGRVIVREKQFDPAAAATLGVPEGPAFGRLANGEPVEIGDEVIDPDVVHTEEVREFRL